MRNFSPGQSPPLHYMEVGAYAAVQSGPDIGREKPTRSKLPLSEQPRAFA